MSWKNKDFPCVNIQSFSELQQFAIGAPSNLRLDFGQGLAADVSTMKVQFGNQHRLGEALATAQLPDDGADDISRLITFF